MNISMQGINFLSSPGSKAVADRIARQQKRDDTIAFLEKQKENLKNVKTHSLEDIQRKLDMFENYDEQINAAKAEYNHSQMFHLLDEAMEKGEKIAEAAEKMAPKTPEERREEMIEEATGVDKNGGILSDVMDELEDQIEELAEMAEDVDEFSEESLEQLSEEFIEVESLEMTEEQALSLKYSEKSFPENYKRIDYRV